MKRKMWIRLFQGAFLLLFGLGLGTIHAQLKRSRGEGLVEMQASNTEGFSNIWIGVDAGLEQRDQTSLLFDPKFAGVIGLAPFMQLSGSMGVPKGIRDLGTTFLSVRITLPGNDNLRLFGVGVSGDLLLSSIPDTIRSKKAPQRMRKPGITLLADIDLIKKMPWLPLKFYFNASTMEDEQIMLAFDPLSFRAGAEYKGDRHSYFVSGSFGLYKESSGGAAGTGASNTYDNATFTLFPGVRYRIGNRMSLVARAKMMLFTKGSSQYLPQKIMGLSFLWEMPIHFKDSNAEAIRALVFVEQKKKIYNQAENPSVKTKSGKEKTALPDGTLRGDQASLLSDESMNSIMGEDYFRQKEELKKHREQALDEMKKIEEMLE
jgi:hypothetical protein